MVDCTLYRSAILYATAILPCSRRRLGLRRFPPDEPSLGLLLYRVSVAVEVGRDGGTEICNRPIFFHVPQTQAWSLNPACPVSSHQSSLMIVVLATLLHVRHVAWEMYARWVVMYPTYLVSSCRFLMIDGCSGSQGGDAARYNTRTMQRESRKSSAAACGAAAGSSGGSSTQHCRTLCFCARSFTWQSLDCIHMTFRILQPYQHMKHARRG